MCRRLLLVSFVFVLGSCAYTLDGAVQDITVLTPGAENALCYVWVDKIKYKVRPPQTTNVVKSKSDMTVECRAPGNRQREVVVASRIAKSTAWNVTNAILPGAMWDSASGAAYEYPDVIEVDFRNMKPRPQKLPAHNSPDILQPEDYMLEEFLPGDPRLNSDKFKPKIVPQLRERNEPVGYTDNDDAFMTGEGAEDTYSKSNLESVIKSTLDINPSNAPPVPVLNPAVNEQPVFPVE